MKKINNKKLMIIPFLLMLMVFSVTALTHDLDGSTLQDSTTYNLTWATDHYEMETGYSNGRWVGDVLSFDDIINISTLSVEPYDYHNLPNNNEIIGSCDMTGNILLLHLDKSSGSVVDSSGKDNNGYTVGTSVREGIGVHNTLAYHGISDGYIEIPHRDSLNLAGSGSLVLAYYPVDGTDHVFISKEDSVGNTGYKIYRDGDLIDVEFDDGVVSASSDTGAFPNTDQWYIVALSWENGVISYYVNGVSYGSDTLGNYTPNTKAIRIGADNDGVKELNGYIDEVAMFNHSLTYDFIQAMTQRLMIDKEVSIKSCSTILCDENYTTLSYQSPYSVEIDSNKYYRVQVDFERLNYNFVNDLELISFDYDIVEDPTPQEYRGEVYKTFGSDNYGTFNNDVIGNWNKYTSYDLAQASRIVDNPDNLVTPKVAYMDDFEKYIIGRDGENLVLFQWDSENGVLNVKDGTDVILSGHTLMSDFIVRKYRDHQYILFLTRKYSSPAEYLYINYVSYDGNVFTHTSRHLGTNGRIERYTQEHHLPMFNCDENIEVCLVGKNWIDQQYSVLAFNLETNLDDGGSIYAPLVYHTAYNEDYDCIFTPMGGNIVMGDIDNDYANGDEYDYGDGVMTYNYRDSFVLLSVNYNESHVWTDWITTKSTGVSSGWTTPPHLQNPPLQPSKWQTGLLATEYNGYESDGKELFFGGVDGNVDNFKIFEFSAQGNDVDEHPDVNNIEGQLISNPFIMDCYKESGVEDVAILGYNENTEKVLLTCSCYTCGAPNDDCEFEDYPEEDFNLSKIFNPAKTVHVIEADGTKGSELVTPFGIYDVNEPEPHTLYCGNNEIQKIYNVQERDSFILPIDYENTGRADLIFSSPYRIKYLDDGFINKKPYVTDVKINPCIEQTWMKDSDVLIKINAGDEEGNDVSYRVKLYANSEFEYDTGWTPYQNINEEYRFQGVASDNIGVGYIEIYIKDESHTTFNLIERYFSVNEDNDSVSFGDCETVISEDELAGEQDLGVYGREEDDLAYTDEYGNKINDNAVKNSVDEVGEMVGLSGLLVYVLLMFAVAMGMFFYVGDKDHPATKLGAIAIVEILLLIFGTMLKIIPVSIVIILSLALLTIVGFWIKSFVTGSRTGGFE